MSSYASIKHLSKKTQSVCEVSGHHTVKKLLVVLAIK